MKILKGICYVFATIGVLAIALSQLCRAGAAMEHDVYWCRLKGKRSELYDDLFNTWD